LQEPPTFATLDELTGREELLLGFELDDGMLLGEELGG